MSSLSDSRKNDFKNFFHFLAAEVLTMSHSFVRMKPLKEATVESRTKAK